MYGWLQSILTKLIKKNCDCWSQQLQNILVDSDPPKCETSGSESSNADPPDPVTKKRSHVKTSRPAAYRKIGDLKEIKPTNRDVTPKIGSNAACWRFFWT